MSRKLLRSPRNASGFDAMDRSPDLRFPSTFPEFAADPASVQWSSAPARPASKLVSSSGFTTTRETRALTVAGQWRSYTAFPSILSDYGGEVSCRCDWQQ